MTIHYFESHLTVKITEENTIGQFKEACKSIDAKPIIINLGNGNIPQQVMTSSTYRNTLNNVYETVKQDVLKLEELGFEVIRTKIEVDSSYTGKSLYSEIHIPCHSRKLVEYPHLLDDIKLQTMDGRTVRGYISRNEFKPNVTFITWRSKFIEDFNYFHSVHGGLLELGVLFNPLDKIELEIAVYDSNEGLDNTWIHGEIV